MIQDMGDFVELVCQWDDVLQVVCFVNDQVGVGVGDLMVQEFFFECGVDWYVDGVQFVDGQLVDDCVDIVVQYGQNGFFLFYVEGGQCMSYFGGQRVNFCICVQIFVEIQQYFVWMFCNCLFQCCDYGVFFVYGLGVWMIDVIYSLFFLDVCFVVGWQILF